MDWTIYSTLCHQIQYDSEKMFTLRLKLIKNGIFAQDLMWNWDNTVANSDKLLRLFKLLLEKLNYNQDMKLRDVADSVYEAQENTISHLATIFPNDSWNTIMPMIDNYTREFNNIYEEGLKHWITEKSEVTPERMSLDISQEIIRKFIRIDDRDVVIALCRAIRDRAEEKWEDDILLKIADIAINNPDPKDSDLNVWLNDDKEGNSFLSIYSNSINCVRGCAADAIASLLWNDSSRYRLFKTAINRLANDIHPAVQMATIECICPVYNFDRENCKVLFLKLASGDVRVAAHPNAYQFFQLLLDDDSAALEEIILNMYNSTDEKISEVGAMHIVDRYLYRNSFLEEIKTCLNGNKVQRSGIVKRIIEYVKFTDKHNKCIDILKMFLNDEDEAIKRNFNQLFYKRMLDFEIDREFIIEIIGSKIFEKISYSVFNSLQESAASLMPFKDVIFAICESVSLNREYNVSGTDYKLYGVVPKISLLLSALFDQSKEDQPVNEKCLYMWDLMFENRVGMIRELSKSIAEM